MLLLDKSDDECKDIIANCRGARRQCKRKTDFLVQNCRKTCKYCTPETTTPTITTPPTKPETITPTITTPPTTLTSTTPEPTTGK